MRALRHPTVAFGAIVVASLLVGVLIIPLFVPWGPEQMIGPPDTWPQAGDVVTSWASLTEDGQDEWVLLEYAEPVRPSAVLVFETYNPGAVSRVLVYKLDGDTLTWCRNTTARRLLDLVN